MLGTLLFAATLSFMGQPSMCECGYIKIWHGVTVSSENSQHLSDWYTFSHVIHGFVFYFLLRFLFPRWSIPARFLAAFGIEAGWELLENSDFIINRYREVTISLDYFGDSIVNSVSDLWMALIGFYLAWRQPVWVTVVELFALEAYVGYVIRDNLILNIIMLLYPLESIREWQSMG